MQPAFACPLASASRFCLSGPSVQRNCNATDLRGLGGYNDGQLPAGKKELRSSQFSSRSNRTGGTDGGGASGRRVEFAAAEARSPKRSRSRGRGQQQQTLSLSQAGPMVPLACSSNQSNKLHPLPGCWSGHNAQLKPAQTESAPQSAQPTAGPCDVPAAGGGGGGGQGLMASCGVPYWNVYEYEDFRELEHGQPHLFDPQIDANLHRENLILDSYNRLLQSCSNFLPPARMYHVR